MSVADGQRITITIDEDGNAEIRSPVEMEDSEVLEILTAAVDATADKILEDEGSTDSPKVTQPLPALTRRKKQYMN